jgi:hypothetical protein
MRNVTCMILSIAMSVVLVSLANASLPTTALFDNNTNYLGFGGGPGGNGPISGKDLNEIISLMPAGTAINPKNFTATTLPVDKYMTEYARQVINQLRREKTEAIAPSPLQFSSPKEMKGGLMERSETMVRATVAGGRLDVFVPVGHEDLARAVANDWATMPMVLRGSSTQTQIWFSSVGGSNVGAGHTFDDVAYVTREELGNPENNAYLGTITVYGVNGTPQALSRGDLAYGLAYELDGMYNRYSKGNSNNALGRPYAS